MPSRSLQFQLRVPVGGGGRWCVYAESEFHATSYIILQQINPVLMEATCMNRFLKMTLALAPALPGFQGLEK
jgi:hypothetical protein